MTGQSGSKAPDEEDYNKEVHITRNGISGAPPWSQAWGWGKHLVARSLPTEPSWAQPERASWARPPVGSPPAGGFRRGRCCVIWVAIMGVGPDNHVHMVPGHPRPEVNDQLCSRVT